MKRFTFFLILLFISTAGAAEPMQNPWLIVTSNGSMLTYNGSDFSYVTSLGEGTYAVESNGRYWLIKKQNIKGTEFFIFNGTYLRNLTQKILPLLKEHNLRINHLKWGDEWLMTSSSAIVELDETRAMVQSAPAGVRLTDAEPSWNGNYWLIAGAKDGKPVLLKYIKGSWGVIPLTDEMKGRVMGIAWNGNYWLICAYFYSKETGVLPKIFKYDGTLVEIPLPEGVFKKGKSADIPVIATWNGNEWIIGVERDGVLFEKLLRFDGRSFKIVHEVGEGTHPLLTDARIGKIRCNSAYCLIYFQNMREMGILAKYDKNKLLVMDNIPGFTSLISDYEWNGKYWLIGEYSLTGGAMLLRYNGTGFINLTALMVSVLPVAIRGTESGRIVFSPLWEQDLKPSKGVCGPTTIVVISLFTLVLRRRHGW